MTESPFSALGKDVLKEIVKFATPNDRERLIQVNREFREAIKELETERKIHRRRIVVSAGVGSTFILTQYRGKPKLYSCGRNWYGQLGLRDNTYQSSLQHVKLPKNLNSLEGVAAGDGHTLVFGRDSKGKPALFACGCNEYGQLGLGDDYNRSSLQRLELPKDLNSLEGVVAGAYHTLVIGRDSFGRPALFACGSNVVGQLGLGNQNNRSSLQRLELPEALNSLEGVVAGYNHTLAFGCDSFGKPALFAFGFNKYGQLGLGHQNNQSSLQRLELPKDLNSLEGVAAGEYHTLVFGRDSKGNLLLYACGSNASGRLGLGNQNNQTSLQRLEPPEALNSLEGVVAGAFHTLVFGCDSLGKPVLLACGYNEYGQLGLGHQYNQNLLTIIPKPVIRDIEKYHPKRGIQKSHYDQLGLGHQNNQSSLTNMTESPFSALGKDVLKEIVKFATPNDRERFIQVNREFREAIKELETERKIHRRKIVASTGAISTFILTQYRGKPLLFACGGNAYGQLGLGHEKNQSSLQTLELPKDLNSLEGVVAGDYHTLVFGCNSLGKPALFSCGFNYWGQLGLGDNEDQNSLQPVRLPKDLYSLEGVAAGARHTLVFGRDSNKKPLLFSCGNNGYGQLGLGHQKYKFILQGIKLPEELKSLDGVAAGMYHTLVFGRDSFGKSALFVCGMNKYGQLGLGDKNNQSSLQRLKLPKNLNSLEGVVAGDHHTLVFGCDSNKKPLLFSCGNNEYGQLGLGHKNDQSSLQPVRLPQELNSLESVVAGYDHTLVFGRDSFGKAVLFACGMNKFGQLGLGHQNNQTSLQSVKLPQDLKSLEGVVASFNHTFVFGCDSFGEPALFACGENDYGQLGLGHKNNQSSLTVIQKPVNCDSEKYRLKMAIERHAQMLSNEFSWFGLKKSPQEKIKILKQLCEILEQVDNPNSIIELRETMEAFLEVHKQTIEEHRIPFGKWSFFSPESPTRTETFLTEKMNSLNT
ncbi:UVB-resistance protein UVR8 [Legionella waltersii]|uniref:RCC1 domain-containing protein n=1 Tax=Legionella waltersii TaxID=66969 RepID=UPI000B94E290|nr:hypothetical protein [Legionella waltersii]SNV05659.1 UVB-resistance protein UVR8 [Legionella waltersii]